MKGRIRDMGKGFDGSLTVTLSLPPQYADEIHALMGEDISAEIKKWREHRSRDANALMWAVCEELAQALKISKIEVYRKAIKDVGVYQPLPIRDDAVDAFCRNWESGGIGWLAEKTDKSKTPGYTLVFAYFGSSTYDSKEFSRLVDCLMDEAEQIGIVLKAGAELEQRLKEMAR
jgi:hypothetical protein